MSMDDHASAIVDIDSDDEGSASASRRRRRAALRVMRRACATALALLTYITLHECGHATACDLAQGFTLDEIEVVNVRVYPVFGAGSGWRKLGARFGETRCAQTDASSGSTKTRGLILMSGFIFTSAVQVLALVSATCGLLPYSVYFICPDWMYYALSPLSEFQKGISLARPEWVMQLEEPDDPETQWTSYNTAIAMIVLSLGTMFFCLQMRQLVKSPRA